MGYLISSQLFKFSKSKVWPIVTVILASVTVLSNFIIDCFQNHEPTPINNVFFDGDFLIIDIAILVPLLLAIDFSSGSIVQIISKGAEHAKYVITTELLVSVGAFLMILVGLGLYCAVYIPVFGMETVTCFRSPAGLALCLCSIMAICFACTCFAQLIMCLSRKLSITLIASVITPLALEIVASDTPLDPKVWDRSLVLSSFSTHLIMISCFLIAGFFFTAVSITALKKISL